MIATYSAVVWLNVVNVVSAGDSPPLPEQALRVPSQSATESARMNLGDDQGGSGALGNAGYKVVALGYSRTEVSVRNSLSLSDLAL